MLLVSLYTAALGLSAFLLFVIQPFFAKLLLPRVGGAPAVWNTCMVFFQAALLAGYGYAHLLSKQLPVRLQGAIHLSLLALAVWWLPVQLPDGWSAPAEANPTWSLLTVMARSVGVPFLILSATAPLFQRWFSLTRHPSARDPYFLYAASNVGSLLALLGYPLVIEPAWRLAEQARLWQIGYGALMLLAAGCVAWQITQRPGTVTEPAPIASHASGERPSLARRLWWLLWAFVPSSLLMGVTLYLSTDVAAIPLFWTVPLALYLLSFIVVFAKRPPISFDLASRLLPFPALLVALAMLTRADQPLWFLIPIHLALLFLLCVICHSRLAQDRPPASELTGFYMWMSLGGVLGGCFNALLAPHIFPLIIEYPLMIVLGCLIWPGAPADKRPRASWRDLAIAALVGLAVVGALHAAFRIDPRASMRLLAALCGPIVLACYATRYRRVRFSACLAALLLAGLVVARGREQTLRITRSFFGVYRVTRDVTSAGEFHLLSHGTTIHGIQSLEPGSRCEPLSYFSRRGPMADVMNLLAADGRNRQVGVLGLGVGSLAAYAPPEASWTFYEIDPTVEQLARAPAYFTYLSVCAPTARVILGDGRLALADAPDGSYDALLMDAFSSDSVPMHLITREAVALYIRKLTDAGILVFNISNRYLNLEPVLGDLAGAFGWTCLSRSHETTRADEEQGVFPSQWVVLLRHRDHAEPLLRGGRWRLVSPRSGRRVWSDDFSNLLEAMEHRLLPDTPESHAARKDRLPRGSRSP